MSRPVIIVGNGVHLARAEEAVRDFCRASGCPILSTWTAADIAPDLPLHIGHFGIFGDRASNLVVQNASDLYVIGASLSIPQTGYNAEHFARDAYVIHIDPSRLASVEPSDCTDWIARCIEWKARYGIDTENREHADGYVNSFDFIREWSQTLPEDAIVVTDMGTAFTCTFQAARIRYGQRWLTASGFAPMGYGLPGAIGAHYAYPDRPVWCVVGDGALQFNIAELQCIKGLPIRVIVIENGGYLTMKHTQQRNFNRLVGSCFDFSNIEALAHAYGVGDQVEVVKIHPMQTLTPRIVSMQGDDGLISRPLEDMMPLLPREELKAQMIVPMVKEPQ